MITALAFVDDKSAANAMLTLAKSNVQDEKEQAAYWLSFRQSNDWYKLLDWSKINLNTAYERKLAAMKVKRQTILDEHQSKDERSWRTKKMAADSVGGQMLIGLMAENKLPVILIPVVQEYIFNNPDLSVRGVRLNFLKEIFRIHFIPVVSWSITVSNTAYCQLAAIGLLFAVLYFKLLIRLVKK